MGYLLPKFKGELDRQRLLAGEGGVRSGQGHHPLSAAQELAVALAFYATGSFQHVAGLLIGKLLSSFIVYLIFVVDIMETASRFLLRLSCYTTDYFSNWTTNKSIAFTNNLQESQNPLPVE